MTYAVLTGCCAHCPPISVRGGGSTRWGSTGQPSDIPLEKFWVVRPQLFFSCHLRPRGGPPPKRANYRCVQDDIQVQLVFYITFEPLDLAGGGLMEAVGVQKLYVPSPSPILFVGLAANVLGRVPLMPLFLLGQLYSDNPTPASLASARQVPTWVGRCRGIRRDGQEGKQRLRGKPVAVAVWAGQNSSGGAECGCD